MFKITSPKDLIDIILHVDEYLSLIIQSYGSISYAILFSIIFVETGLVIMPFLPGDSLLFAAGTFAAIGAFNVYTLFIVVFIAAILGDTVNYWIGNKLGPKVFERKSRFIKKEHLIKTQRFYKKHGGKTIVIARFMPIIRTFAPFVAGVGTMEYSKFIFYNIFGGFLWTSLFTFGGYFFGNIPIVRENFETVILAIIFISILPMIIEIVKSRRNKNVEDLESPDDVDEEYLGE